MNIAIISSTKDKAGTNIKESLINNFDFNKIGEDYEKSPIYGCIINNKKIKIYTIDSELISKENIDKEVNADLFLFISKHRAKEERKTLTVHPIGNFGKAEFGGKDKALCIVPSLFFKLIFNELAKNSANSGYEVTVEATHHGPYLEKPVLFIEIGSTEKEWMDKEATNIVASSITNSIKNFDDKNIESVFVVGGGHYSHIANKLMLKDKYSVGHVCGKYNLENLDMHLMQQSIEKAMPKTSFLLLDWKGLGKEKQRILRVLEENRIDYRRSDKFP